MAKHKRRPKQKHVPLRTCVACRETKPKRDLVRIVLTPEGHITVDETGKQNGRGAYLCRRRLCWQKALQRGSLSRALRAQLSPQDIALLEAYAESMPESATEVEAEAES
ncbi:MAG: RNase P modulator RnpM [Anaerolineae bacterium]